MFYLVGAIGCSVCLFLFGTIYQNLLGDNPKNAIRFAGVFLGIAGLVMLWIREPPIVRDLDAVA